MEGQHKADACGRHGSGVDGDHAGAAGERPAALPSEVPDRTPMVDGRVRAIEQVGNNIWLAGRISQVEKRDGTVRGNVGNLAILNSQTDRYRDIAPKLGGPTLKCGTWPSTGRRGLPDRRHICRAHQYKENLVLVDGATGKVIRGTTRRR